MAPAAVCPQGLALRPGHETESPEECGSPPGRPHREQLQQNVLAGVWLRCSSHTTWVSAGAALLGNAFAESSGAVSLTHRNVSPEDGQEGLTCRAPFCSVCRDEPGKQVSLQVSKYLRSEW